MKRFGLQRWGTIPAIREACALGETTSRVLGKSAVNLRRLRLISTFLLSGSLFSLEFLVTRIFSYLLWYHYVFVVISTAVLGLGLGALWIEHKLTTGGASSISVSQLGWRLCLVSASTVFLLYVDAFKFFPVLYMALGVAPFAVGGAILSMMFVIEPDSPHVLYSVDLLGTAVFAAGSLFVLNSLGMMASIGSLFAAMTLLQALLCAMEGRLKGLVSAAIACLIAVVPVIRPLPLLEAGFGNPQVNPKMMPYLYALGKEPKVEYTRWDSLSRTDVVDTGDSKNKTVFMDAGSVSAMPRFDGNLESVADLKKSPGYIPFALQSKPKSLIIGSGGGKEVLLALLSGSQDITAVEINRSTVEAVNAFAEYNGGLYRRPEVRTVVDDGRSFVERTSETYDNIYLGLVMTQSAGAQGLTLTENYIFTLEAMSRYLSRLRAGGQVVFLAHDEDDMGKITATAISALQARGLSFEQAKSSIAVVGSAKMLHADPKHVHYPVVLIRAEPFSSADSSKTLQFASQSGMDPVHIPGLVSANAFPVAGFESLNDLVSSSGSYIAPSTDNRPYFYNFSAGAPVTVYFVLGLVLLAMLKWFAPRYGTMDRGHKPIALYFFYIGIAYMAVEVVLIQRNTLLMGHQSLAFALTVPALLCGSGLGSLASPKFAGRVSAITTALGLAVMALPLLYAAAMPVMLANPLGLRALLAVGVALPLGFLMGIPFPVGMKRAKETNSAQLVPLLWGINGVASLFGSTLAIVVAMRWGLSAAFVFGAISYLAAGRNVPAYQVKLLQHGASAASTSYISRPSSA